MLNCTACGFSHATHTPEGNVEYLKCHLRAQEKYTRQAEEKVALLENEVQKGHEHHEQMLKDRYVLARRLAESRATVLEVESGDLLRRKAIREIIFGGPVMMVTDWESLLGELRGKIMDLEMAAAPKNRTEKP